MPSISARKLRWLVARSAKERLYYSLSFLPTQYPENFLQSLAHFLEVVAPARLGEGQPRLQLRRLRFGLELLAGTCDGEAFFIEQFLDTQHILDVALAVHTLTGAALHRLQLREFGLPEAQHVGWKLTEFGNFSDAEIQLVRDHRVFGDARLSRFFLAIGHRSFRERPHFPPQLGDSVTLSSSMNHPCKQPRCYLAQQGRSKK